MLEKFFKYAILCSIKPEESSVEEGFLHSNPPEGDVGENYRMCLLLHEGSGNAPEEPPRCCRHFRENLNPERCRNPKNFTFYFYDLRRC